MRLALTMTGRKLRKVEMQPLKNGSQIQLSGKSLRRCRLSGSDTASRPWVIHEIQEAWNAKKGVVGIRIHGLKDRSGYTSNTGANPFDKLTLKNGAYKLSSQVQLKWPSGANSTDVYASIKDNIADWVEEAITAITQQLQLAVVWMNGAYRPPQPIVQAAHIPMCKSERRF